MRPLATAAACVLLAAAAGAQVPYERLLKAGNEPQTWLPYSGGYPGPRYSPGPDGAETARPLELNPGTVKTSLFRARVKLAAALGDPAAADDDQEEDRARLR